MEKELWLKIIELQTYIEDIKDNNKEVLAYNNKLIAKNNELS